MDYENRITCVTNHEIHIKIEEPRFFLKLHSRASRQDVTKDMGQIKQGLCVQHLGGILNINVSKETYLFCIP